MEVGMRAFFKNALVPPTPILLNFYVTNKNIYISKL